MTVQLNELLAENAELRERLARRDAETDNLTVQVQQANAAAIVAQQEANAVVVAAQQEASAVVAAAQQEANAVVAAAQQEANAVVVAAQQAANAQVAAAAAVAAAPPPPPLLQTSMPPPMAAVSVVPQGGMGNGLTAVPVPSSLPLAVAASGALNMVQPAPTPAAPIKQEMVVNPAAVPVPVQAASMMVGGEGFGGGGVGLVLWVTGWGGLLVVMASTSCVPHAHVNSFHAVILLPPAASGHITHDCHLWCSAAGDWQCCRASRSCRPTTAASPAATGRLCGITTPAGVCAGTGTGDGAQQQRFAAGTCYGTCCSTAFVPADGDLCVQPPASTDNGTSWGRWN